MSTNAAREAVERLLRIDRRTFTLKAGDEQIILAALAEADEIKSEFAQVVKAIRALAAMAADLTLTLDEQTNHLGDLHEFPRLKRHVGVGAQAMLVLQLPHARVVAQEDK